MASFTHVICRKIVCREGGTARLTAALRSFAGWQRLVPGAVLVCLAIFTPFSAQPAKADEWLDKPSIRAEGSTAPSSSFVAQPSLTAAQAAAKVRREHGGRVLSVNPARRGDALGYRVRVLIDGGRVKTLYIASGAASGSANGSTNEPGSQADSAPLPRSRVRTIGDR